MTDREGETDRKTWADKKTQPDGKNMERHQQTEPETDRQEQDRARKVSDRLARPVSNRETGERKNKRKEHT